MDSEKKVKEKKKKKRHKEKAKKTEKERSSKKDTGDEGSNALLKSLAALYEGTCLDPDAEARSRLLKKAKRFGGKGSKKRKR